MKDLLSGVDVNPKWPDTVEGVPTIESFKNWVAKQRKRQCEAKGRSCLLCQVLTCENQGTN